MCSLSILVTTAMVGDSNRKLPSLSSASATRNSPWPSLGVGAEHVHPATDHHRRVQTRRAQHRRDHRRGRGFAVAAGHRDAVFHAHQLGEHFGARNHRDMASARFEHFRIGIFYRGGDHYDRRVAGKVFFLMADKNPRAERAQAARRIAVVKIGAGHAYPEFNNTSAMPLMPMPPIPTK